MPNYIPKRKHANLTEEQNSQIANDADMLKKLGINVVSDNATTVSNASIGGSLPALTANLQGIVTALTPARNIDQLVGITNDGSWHDEAFRVQSAELTGEAREYGDNVQIPYASYNTEFVTRGIIRFEIGFEVTNLEAAQATATGIDARMFKQQASMTALEVMRNKVGFYGVANKSIPIHGLLNDPNLLPYVNAPVGASGDSEFSELTVDERKTTLLFAFSQLRTQTQDRINPTTANITIAVGTSVIDLFFDESEYKSTSLKNWLDGYNPNINLVSAPELDSANGNQNVMYVYADSVNDEVSTDDGRSMTQLVAERAKLLGTDMSVKGMQELYSNAIAGVLVKRPLAIVRLTGV